VWITAIGGQAAQQRRFFVLGVFPSAANSRNKILATVWALIPAARCAALVPCAVFTVTNPARDRLYEPLIKFPLNAILTSFHINQLVHALNVIETAPGVSGQSAADSLVRLVAQFVAVPAPASLYMRATRMKRGK
jgi:hypothetical protein